jgi:hypothetical protein
MKHLFIWPLIGFVLATGLSSGAAAPAQPPSLHYIPPARLLSSLPTALSVATGLPTGRARTWQGTRTARITLSAPVPRRYVIFDGWLHVQLDRRGPPLVSSEVDVLLNGHAVAELMFGRGWLDGRPVLTWSSYDLFGGPSAGLVRGHTITLHYRNYAQIGSIHRGTNRVSLALYQFGGIALARATLAPGARLWTTPVSPARLVVQPTVAPHHLALGQIGTLHYTLDDLGLPARDVTVCITTASLALVDAPCHSLTWLEHGSMAVRFLALRPGRHILRLLVTAATGTGGLPIVRTVPISVGGVTER